MNTFEKGQFVQYYSDSELITAKIESISGDVCTVSFVEIYKGRKVTVYEDKQCVHLQPVSNDRTILLKQAILNELHSSQKQPILTDNDNKAEFIPSLRDMVAMHALQGLLAQETKEWYSTKEQCVSDAFKIADEFLEQRNQKGGAND